MVLLSDFMSTSLNDLLVPLSELAPGCILFNGLPMLPRCFFFLWLIFVKESNEKKEENSAHSRYCWLLIDERMVHFHFRNSYVNGIKFELEVGNICDLPVCQPRSRTRNGSGIWETPAVDNLHGYLLNIQLGIIRLCCINKCVRMLQRVSCCFDFNYV